MDKFTKDNIDDKVIQITQVRCGNSRGTVFDLRKVVIMDVTLAGDEARIFYPLSSKTAEVNTDSPYNTIFKHFPAFWDWITKTVFSRIPEGTQLYGRFWAEGADDYRLIIDENHDPDNYGHRHMLGTTIKYGELIPDEYNLINVKAVLMKWFTDYCGAPSYSADETTEWGQCINCGSDDVYFEYEDTDNAYTDGEYIDVWKCAKCGARTKQTYKLSRSGRSLVED